MTNIFYLSQDANPKIRKCLTENNDGVRILELLNDADDCIVKIAGLMRAATQALKASLMLLDNLGETIPAIPDPRERLILERKRTEAQENVLVNFSTIFQALEFMAASARTIRDKAHEMVRCKTHTQ